jgi:hypothetical protein
MDASKTRRLLFAAACAAIVLLAPLVWKLVIAPWLQGPLAGQRTHDFGTVAVVGTAVELHHVFHLKNRMRRPVTVRAVRPDCGCLAAHAGGQTIQPGEYFDLPVTLALAGQSKKNVLITLDLGEGGIQTLRVKATPRLQTK